MKHMTQMPLAKYDDMIKAVPPDRTDDPFRASCLPRRARRDRPSANAHRRNAPSEDLAVRRIPVANKICGASFQP
jgi:hypothetical protein